MTEYKFSIDEELNEQLNDNFNPEQFYDLLENMFGFLASRQLTKYDYEKINFQIACVVKDVCLKMEGFYLDKRYTETFQASMNVFKASLAGGGFSFDKSKEFEEL